MLLSLDWLKQYVDIGNQSPDEVALRLTMATAEAEGVEKLTRTVKDILVAEIVEIEAIDTGDSGKKMNLVTVDLGGKTLKSVCGAPNVLTGMKSPFAVAGTELSGGMKVKKQEVYGAVSEGVLCSPLELGWGESHVGIMSFPETIETGASVADFVPETDYIIEIDNKTITHRPDLWGHYGFARELSAIYGCELKSLDVADSALWEKYDAFPLQIKDYESCPGYACLDIGNLKPAYSPFFIQYHLLAIGLRPINLLVDLTNYLMLELGQPMHAFDGERVRDIIVAPFGSDGTFRTLDSIERKMIPEDLMIMDHTGPIAVAGIMGGEESEIKEDTSRMLLESANFNPSRIRKSALRLGLRTDASLRFEKDQPPYHMGESIKRFVRLLETSGQKPSIHSRLSIDGNDGETHRTINMKSSYVSKTIGMDISREKVVEILESLEFGCDLDDDNLDLSIPLHRSARDISIPNDIVEEVARIYGYDNIEPAMPLIELRKYQFNVELQKQHKVRRLMSLSRSYSEAYTYSWFDDVWLKKLNYNPGETLELMNPPTEHNTRMRVDILPNLLSLVEPNSSHRDSFAMYEIGNVFHPKGDSCDQVVNIAGISYQSAKVGKLQDLFLAVKGTIEEMFVLVNSDAPEFVPSKDYTAPWCFENACMNILLKGKNIGKIGYITGKMNNVFDKDVQVAWFELDLDAVVGKSFPDISLDALPVFPGSWMDFSIVADKSSSFTDLSDIVNGFSHAILKRSKYLYSYQGKGLADDKSSYSFRFWLGLTDRTLTGDDLTGFRSDFLAYLDKKGLTLR